MRVLLALVCCLAFIPAAAAQALHAGDTLQITVLQDPTLNRQVVVGPDGMIAFPLAGHIRAGGMTPQALESVLKKRLKKNYNSGLDITVALASFNKEDYDESKPRVYVTGEVAKPGPYLLKPPVDVVQAISLAGGLGPFAARRRIQVHRQSGGGNRVLLFNYDAYEDGSQTAGNIKLRSGDVIIVPERGLFE